MAQSPDELFDVVDDSDRVVGQARRADVHAQGLLHRAVHIFVFNERNELLLQMRSAAKDEYPLTYTSSASGHVDSGEDYDSAAHRELSEELGLSGELRRLHKFKASAATSNEHTVLYFHRTTASVRFDSHEIEHVEYVDPESVQHRMQAAPEKFAPAFRTLFEWYLTNAAADKMEP